MMALARVSVIIPVLDESALLPRAISSCVGEGADEIIVADGGSTDGSGEVSARPGVRLVRVNPPQRARQMNAGACVATGELLVFLHADTVFETGALAALRRVAKDIVGGGFRRVYQCHSPLLAASCRVGNFRARHFGWCFGDQAIWVRREIFETLGGFPEKPLFEDFDFTRRVRDAGPMMLVTPGVQTSARRFQQRTVSRLAKDFFLTVRHVCLKEQ